MSNISIRPDMRTDGGEVCDIVLNGHYVGDITLVYREGSRLSGSIQLEKSTLTPGEKDQVVQYVQDYVYMLASALDVEDCDVVVTYSYFDQVIAMERGGGEITRYVDAEDDVNEEADYVDHDTRLSDIGVEEQDRFEMKRKAKALRQADHRPAGQRTLPERASAGKKGARAKRARKAKSAAIRTADRKRPTELAETYELVITGEHGNSVEYHLYGKGRRWLAEAFVTLYGSDCIGEMNWMVEPTSEQIEQAVDLLVSDFDDDLVDSFRLEIKHNGELLEVYELEHEDFADLADAAADSGQDDYSVRLVRDDGDTLTYEIFSGKKGSIPIGTATVDISRRDLSGYIDIRERGGEEEHEKIAAQLMRELDKEKEFESFNVTVLYRNRPIDEILFENVPLQ